MSRVRFFPAGDSALIAEFGSEIAPEINAKVSALAASLRQRPLRGVVETVPTFRSLLVHYDPCRVRFDTLARRLQKRADTMHAGVGAVRHVFHIPVLYNGEDLGFVAQYAGLSKEEVVVRHSAPEYLIYMLGFLPGFAYLGGLDPSIHTPRLQNPRTKIPAGAVGIGGEQTGIYPLASPGGWQLIGQTPVLPYNPQRDPPILYAAGDFIRFVPVDANEFETLEQRQAAGEQIWEVTLHG
jgi:KipI family sensor histidine kinase inhibitor